VSRRAPSVDRSSARVDQKEALFVTTSPSVPFRRPVLQVTRDSAGGDDERAFRFLSANERAFRPVLSFYLPLPVAAPRARFKVVGYRRVE